MPTSFKVSVLRAFHDFTASTGNTFKLALLKATASGSGTFGAATTNYSDLGSDELGSGSGYTTGGNTLTSITPTSDGTTAICTVGGTSGRACAVLSFGGDQQVSSGDFQIQFPAAAASTAIIRIA